MKKLELCPFCKNPVKIRMRTDGYCLWYSIEHEDAKLCKAFMVSEQVETECGKEVRQNAREKLIAAWNTRAGAER